MQFDECNFEYYTPKYIVDRFGTFDYDPATTEKQAAYLNIKAYDTILTNGLHRDWGKYKKIWINPPLYLAFQFLEKAVSTYRQVSNDIYFLAPISILTKKKFQRIIEDCKIVLYIPSKRINFLQIHQEKEITPDFDSIIFKLHHQSKIKFFDIIIPGTHYILNETDV